jgi:apocytochrome f
MNTSNYFKIHCLLFFSFFFFLRIKDSLSFPIYAQQAYENPREANGKIACANCHLAQKSVQLEIPSSVLPNSFFEAVVKIPYDINTKQLLGTGKEGGLNVGAILFLPEKFKLANSREVPKDFFKNNKKVYISPYSSRLENILVVGPIAGDKNQEITFPLRSPDPLKEKSINFLKYPVYAGGNRGRGQINPTGDKSNNNPVVSTISGTVQAIDFDDNNGIKITSKTKEGLVKTQTLSQTYTVAIQEGDYINIDQPITKDPNVGGFGQAESEIVLQQPERIRGYIFFSICVLLTQISLVIKKKQYEKVQKSEINF